MTMKKKLLTTLSVVLILALAALGILAYLTSTDSDVNVMTLGNVQIEQHEYERVQKADGNYEMVTSDKYGDGYKLQEFTQAKPLYPATGTITGWGTIVPFDQIGEGATGGQKVFAGLNNVQDKFVLVENTGKSDAYVRTLIAFESGSNEKDIIGFSSGDFWTWNNIGIIEIDGNNYEVYEAIYNGSSTRHIGGILPAGEYTYNSLGQVYLKNEATNEDCEALDGNGNGTYDILVFSQAVQTEGFEDAETALNAAFGDVTTANHPWQDLTFVEDAAELEAALGNDGTVVLTDNVVVNKQLTVAKGKTVTLDLGGNTLSGAFDKAGSSAVIYNTGELTVKNGSVVSLAEFPDDDWGTEGFPTYATNTITNRGTLTIEKDAIIQNQTNTGGASYAIDNQYSWAGVPSVLTVNGGTILAKDVAIRLCASTADYDNSVTINDGTITGKRAVWIQLTGSTSSVAPKANLVVNGGVLTGTSNLAIYSYSYGNSFKNTNVTITGGTFNGSVDFGGGYKGDTENVVITGGTFNDGVGRWVTADDYVPITVPTN